MTFSRPFGDGSVPIPAAGVVPAPAAPCLKGCGWVGPGKHVPSSIEPFTPKTPLPRFVDNAGNSSEEPQLAVDQFSRASLSEQNLFSFLCCLWIDIQCRFDSRGDRNRSGKHVTCGGRLSGCSGSATLWFGSNVWQISSLSAISRRNHDGYRIVMDRSCYVVIAGAGESFLPQASLTEFDAPPDQSRARRGIVDVDQTFMQNTGWRGRRRYQVVDCA